MNIRENPLLKQRIGAVATSVFRYLFLISVSYIVIFQLLYILTYAFRPNEDMFDSSIVWVNKRYSLENIKLAVEKMEFWRSLKNTLLFLVVSALIEVITCAVPAYGLSRFKFKGRTLMFIGVIITIIVPPQMIVVPMSLNYSHFDVFGILKLLGNMFGKEIRPNLLDGGFVFWLPSLFGNGIRSGLFIFIYMQFFKTMPKELEEAASLDGASPLQVFTKIILPSSGVVMLTVTILSVVWHWNDYHYSTIYFTDNKPLSVKLQGLSASLTSYGVSDDRGVRMAGCLVFVLPMLIMYVILQRKFIKSIDRVGIVG